MEDWAYRLMMGDAIADAVFDARARVSDPNITARCGLPDAPGWYVEAGDPVAVVAQGLTEDEAVAYLSGMP